MRIKCLAQGHYCHCQQIQTGDLMIESQFWSYPLSHNSSSTSCLTLCLPRSPICHVCKLAKLADLQLYTHLLFIRIAQWSDYHCFWFALCACIINLASSFSSYDLQVKRYSELKILLPKWHPNSSAPQIMWHTVDLYVANKELNCPMYSMSFSSYGVNIKWAHWKSPLVSWHLWWIWEPGCLLLCRGTWASGFQPQ